MVLAAAVGLLAAGALTSWRLGWLPVGKSLRLPTGMRLETVLTDLGASFERSVVVAEGTGEPVRPGTIQPGQDYDVEGDARPAILASPPSHLRFRTRVPADASLKLSAGIEGPGKRDPDAAGVRFEVRIDGRQVFSRTINPAAHRADRRWLETSIALDQFAEREVDVELLTAQDGSGHLAGVPGWSHVRIVREAWRDRQPATQQGPNVLVVLVDTLRADRVGEYGAAPSPTPALDRLAGNGLVFERVVAPSPWTPASVATYLTGLHPRSHGVGSERTPDVVDHEQVSIFLPDASHTLAEVAADAGITTVAVSANPLISRGTNFAQGFETFIEFSWSRPRADWAQAAEVNDAFLRWLGANRQHRFLAYLHYMEPHDPYLPPEALRPPPPAGIRPQMVAGRPARLSHREEPRGEPPTATEVAYLRQLYDGDIRTWDDAFAALMSGLEALGLSESTIVVVTADHGEEFLEHGRLRHVVHLYDESILIPLVIAGPGVKRGRVAEQVQGIDLLPTLAALLGIEPRPELAGQNLLAGHEARPAISQTPFGALPDGTTADIVSVRTAAWKIIWAPERGTYQLYDLVRDPAERENRFGTAPESGALVDLAAAWRAGTTPAAPVAARDPELAEKLRALGYVQ